MSLLNRVMIQSPCTANWDAMSGDARSRHCGLCNLSVYNLSAMSTTEAETLLQSHGSGRLCVRYYQRPDGTVMTQDCSTIRARQHQRARLLHKGVAASVLFLTLAGSLTVLTAAAESTMGDRALLPTAQEAVAEPPVMGLLAPPPSQVKEPSKPLKPCKTVKHPIKPRRHHPTSVMGGKGMAPSN